MKSELPEGLVWRNVYWVRGELPKGVEYRSYVKDPPCAGWQPALVIQGEKRSTLFCPYTMDAWTVPNHAGEIEKSQDRAAPDVEWLVGLITRKWNEYQGFGFQRDYDTATLVLKRLGAPVPEQILRGGEEDTRKKGGKATGKSLVKPVKLASKRGKFLMWFLENGSACTVREAMAEFGMSRSNALSYLYMLQKDHGIGYELVGDTANVMLPDGCDNPFDEPSAVTGNSEPVVTGNTDDDDDSWLD